MYLHLPIFPSATCTADHPRYDVGAHTMVNFRQLTFCSLSLFPLKLAFLYSLIILLADTSLILAHLNVDPTLSEPFYCQHPITRPLIKELISFDTSVFDYTKQVPYND